MNDTETEMRHLLTVATEDMPPGIDLLAGLARARRRDRVRRTRVRAVLSAGVATAAAVTAAVLAIGSAPPALATITTALTRTLAQSYHLTETDSFFVIARGQTNDSAAQTCTIAADPVRHLEASTCSEGTISMRKVDGYIYLNLLPGTKWDQVPAASYNRPWPPNLNDYATGATPQEMLSAIEKADKVTVAGSASGPGWTGTRYTISGRLSKTDTISGTLDVDQQGRARVLNLTTRMGNLGVVQDLTFSDFGVRVTVTPPPADQTTRTTVSHLPWPWNLPNVLF